MVKDKQARLNSTSASRIEVLTSPLAHSCTVIASGGVIQTFTREAGATPEASNYSQAYGLTRTDWQLSGRAGAVGIVADFSNFGIEGYRVNSAGATQTTEHGG
jgi:outer membrane cobalamin receptor